MLGSPLTASRCSFPWGGESSGSERRRGSRGERREMLIPLLIERGMWGEEEVDVNCYLNE